MRVIVMFDLPMQSKNEKKEYSKFRKFLLKNGYVMMQFSVYSRFCRNNTDMHKHIERVVKAKPKYGNVRILQVTEKQYINMAVVTGEFDFEEKAINREAMTII